MFSYAQNFEDVYILRAFRDVTDGFYVDAGAYDPVIDSVTKIFYDRGWSGINIEPGPVFEKLKRHRPRDINVQFAVSDRIGDMDFFLHEKEPGTSTLSSELDPHLVGRVPSRHKSRVRTSTLSALLDAYAPGKHIHFLKLDVEGAEEAIIKITDWRKYRPELLVVEATEPYSHERRDGRWNATLQNAGYSLVFFDGINAYYLREESSFRKDAFGLPVNVLDYVKKYDFDIERAGELEREVVELNTDIAALQSERDSLLRDIKIQHDPRLPDRDLAITRTLKVLVRKARTAHRLFRERSAVWLDHFNERILRRASKPVDLLAAGIEEAALTLELRAHDQLPRLNDRAHLAHIAEKKLRRFALQK